VKIFRGPRIVRPRRFTLAACIHVAYLTRATGAGCGCAPQRPCGPRRCRIGWNVECMGGSHRHASVARGSYAGSFANRRTGSCSRCRAGVVVFVVIVGPSRSAFSNRCSPTSTQGDLITRAARSANQ
jgi:hypothetical protein